MWGRDQVKLQWNRGGGSFPLHFDNPSPPSARQLSVILYLNPGWEPHHGGRLVLSPFLQPEVRTPPAALVKWRALSGEPAHPKSREKMTADVRQVGTGAGERPATGCISSSNPACAQRVALPA